MSVVTKESTQEIKKIITININKTKQNKTKQF